VTLNARMEALVGYMQDYWHFERQQWERNGPPAATTRETANQLINSVPLAS